MRDETRQVNAVSGGQTAGRLVDSTQGGRHKGGRHRRRECGGRSRHRLSTPPYSTRIHAISSPSLLNHHATLVLVSSPATFSRCLSPIPSPLTHSTQHSASLVSASLFPSSPHCSPLSIVCLPPHLVSRSTALIPFPLFHSICPPLHRFSVPSSRPPSSDDISSPMEEELRSSPTGCVILVPGHTDTV